MNYLKMQLEMLQNKAEREIAFSNCQLITEHKRAFFVFEKIKEIFEKNIYSNIFKTQDLRGFAIENPRTIINIYPHHVETKKI